MKRRRLFISLVAFIILFSFISGTSLVRYVLAHPNEPLQQNVASWARNKGLGGVVDQLETWLHNEAPAVAPAASLALAPIETSIPESTFPDSTVLNVATTTTIKQITSPAVRIPTKATASCPAPPPSTTLPGDTTSISTTSTTTTTTTTTSSTLPGETTTTTTTTTTIPNRPQDVPSVLTPALPGEGKWSPVMRVRSKPIVYASSIRPLWCFGSVVATMAVYNPTRVHTALFNGTEVPGGKGWKNSSTIKGRALPSLIASFNGGFRFEHNPGGYITEGREVRKMRKGYATFGIRADGSSTVGVWGDDMRNDGTWTSLRQNLPPLVQDGKSVYKDFPKVDWGKDYDDKLYNYRSAVCRRLDGMMMFVAVGNVNIGMLADTLLLLGCDTGMELDINGKWPHFATYENFGKQDRRGNTIDTRMGDPNRHLIGATKDFFGLFDPETLPLGVVR